MLTTYRAGDWLAICDRCGFKMHASKLRDTWDNFKVCDRCWYPRHPQERIRAVPDNPAAPWSRPEGDATFVTKDDVTAESL